MYELTIDYRRCAKSGQCFYMFPEFVREGDHNFPHLKQGEVSAIQKARAEELVDICPVGAIRLRAEN